MTTKAAIREALLDIANELTDHPERWTQYAFGLSVNRTVVPSGSELAVSWCLEGHFRRRDIFDSPDLHLDKSPIYWNYPHVGAFNDAPGRTVADIIALCHYAMGYYEEKGNV